MPSTEPAPAQGSTEAAQTRQLQATIDRQAAEIQSLKATVAALSGQLVEAGLTPITRGEVTLPAKRPQKVLFLIHCGGGSNIIYGPERAYAEVIKAIGELQPPQSFSIFFSTGKGFVAQQRGSFIPATAENRRRAAEFMKGQPLGHTNLAEGLKRALGWDPDLVWVLAVGEVNDGEEVAQAVKEANATRRIPIHTTLGFTYNPRHAGNHVLWQLAKDSGGTCINEKGEVADEPVVPAVVVENKPQPPTTKPSVLKVR